MAWALGNQVDSDSDVEMVAVETPLVGLNMPIKTEPGLGEKQPDSDSDDLEVVAVETPLIGLTKSIKTETTECKMWVYCLIY